MADSSSEQNNSAMPKIWTEKTIFSKSITFSSDQIFPIEGLSYNNYVAGSILYATGNKWEVLKPSKNNQVLTFNARGLNWQTPNFSYIEGVLPVSKGGTGWSLFPDNGILINTGKEMLDLLPIPLEKKLLIGENKSLSWLKLSEIASEVLSNFKTIKTIGNDAIFEEFNPCFKIKDQQAVAGMSLSFFDNSFFLGVNKNKLRNFNQEINSSGINFDFKNNKILFEINDTKVLELDESCYLNNVFLKSSQIDGKISISQGGLGDLKFDRGDLIYAVSSKDFAVLSPEKCEGYYLQIKDGLPKYAPLDKSGFDGKFEFPIVLSNSKNQNAPLKFVRSPLIEKTIEGSMEYDGNYLYFTNEQGRRAISFLTSSIVGTASNVTGIVAIENGGTGQNLKNLSNGQILIKGFDTIGSFEQGTKGSFLMSQGPDALPAWRQILSDIEAETDSGLILNKKESVITLRLDQSINFNPVWQGNHVFVQPLKLNSQLKISDNNLAPLNFAVNKSIPSPDSGDLWFDGTHLNFFNGSQIFNICSSESFQIQSNDNIQSHYLTLAAGTDVSENRKIRMKTPVPHLSTKGNLAQANWRVRKLEILFDEPPSEANAIFKLKCSNKTLIDEGLVFIGKDYESFDNFNETVVSTGEIFQLECVNAGGSNFWSAFLLIDLI